MTNTDHIRAVEQTARTPAILPEMSEGALCAAASSASKFAQRPDQTGLDLRYLKSEM